MVAEGCNSGTTGLMAVEGCGSGTIVLMVAKEYNSSSTRLMVAEGCNSGTTRLMVAEGCNSGMNRLMVVKGCNSGTIGLMVAEGCDSGTTGLMVAEGCNSSTTGLMAAKGMPQEYMLVDHACPARGYLGLRRLHACRFTLQTVACRTGNSGNSRLGPTSSSFAPLIPLIRSDVLSGSSSVKVVPSASSEGTQSEGPKASVSGSLCSRIPSRQTPSYKEILRCHGFERSVQEAWDVEREKCSNCWSREFTSGGGSNPRGDFGKEARREFGSRPGGC
ncbi:hypothetical protein BHE74_00049796 [Ensete ventricosum]|nr:hypothetical protein BHE74_00049796 [Ensete ventricosum]